MSIRSFPLALLSASLLLAHANAQAPARGAAPVGEPVLGEPTLHSLGVHWVIAGDENQNAEVRMAWRTPGATWKNGMPLLRVEKGAHKPEKFSPSVDVPDNARLYAGSLLLLQPDTAYELILSLVDPDGGNIDKVLQARTIAEPTAPKDATVYHVTPGNGGGSGSAADPFRGFQAAQKSARPGALFLLHAGAYPSEWVVAKNGEPGRPIIWRAAGDGEVVIDGTNFPEQPATRLIGADSKHDVWFEGLTLRNGTKGISGNNSARIIVRGCKMTGVQYGIVGFLNENDVVRGWFIADNEIQGPSTWPRTKGIESARGIQLSGAGHVVCYNRIRCFADAVDTVPSNRCADIDFHNNDISEMTDDGAELDYSERNVRCFFNRFTNVFQGVTTQPLYGGPAYIFRNALYNVEKAPFKLHNSPSGALIFHNTVVKVGGALSISAMVPVRNCRTRNNLFIGTGGNYAFESQPKMQDCDFDYDGIGGGPWKQFLKWNDVRYPTFEEVRQKAPIWKHAVIVDSASAFASGATPPSDGNTVQTPPDLQLKPGTAAIDTGEPIAGLNDGFAGKAPDLGAYEIGTALPHYGPRKK